MKTLESYFGPNTALVKELYDQYKEDPDSVPDYWRNYFDEIDGEFVPPPSGKKQRSEKTQPEQVSDRKSNGQPAEEPKAKEKPEAKPEKAEPKQKEPQKQSEPETAEAGEEELYNYIKLKGVQDKIAQNMSESTEVPTATSLRVLPVKMLLEDRKVINSHLQRRAMPKTTMTHFIAWAIVKALSEYPKLNSFYSRKNNTGYRVEPKHINLGVAVDLAGKDGTRNLVVPNIKKVDEMDFREFMEAFNNLIEKARKGTLDPSDFEGTTISITNPGPLGTVSSMPRLMKNQGAIIATGAIEHPAEFQSMSPEVLNHLGISEVMTMTCTYDHRVIQGAESGAFLGMIHKLLTGQESFFDEIFADLDIPYDPIPFAQDNYTGLLEGAGKTDEVNKKAVQVMQFINMYRRRGHLLADLNPLHHERGYFPELEFEYYGLTMWDLDREFYCGGLGGMEKAKLRDIINLLRDTYSGHIGSEYSHILELEERQWLQKRMENNANQPDLAKEDKRRILRMLNQASAFEEFLHKKYIGHKRFSLEGAESLIPMLDFMLEKLGKYEAEEVVLGMAHRGRLNVLVNTIGKSYQKVFAEFEGNIDPDSFHGSGDVKYHLGTTGIHKNWDGREIKMTLMPNPSHLESVNPVVEGAARAHQDAHTNGDAQEKIVPFLMHGDAAFAGQGVVAETLNMSQLQGYSTGGTFHVIVNNQIGFTTLPGDGRSTEYASDLAKAILAPIFHVNGDDPEAAVHAMNMAVEYRQKFGKDVVIDLMCYRKHGHNEGDEPAFTQPGLYKEIKDHPSVRQRYTQELVHKGELSQEEVDEIFNEFDELLEEAFKEAKKAPEFKVTSDLINRKDTLQKDRPAKVDTTFDRDQLIEIGRKLNTLPKDFDANPKLLRILAKRSEIVEKNERKIDWGFAESLAFGSLLVDKIPVRLTGQDSERGTFSHRHAVLHGTTSKQKFAPLNHLEDDQATFKIYNSLLSEFAVLGFEFGYSATRPEALVLWEAQFGDFNNGAQVIIDQYIAASEAKWGQKSGVVMLLPHGFEGQGPEHSSARLERFLQLCAEDNLQVANCTTPAQYYHLLRRQALRKHKKPLIIMTPKSLLRHTKVVSTTDELAEGSFQEFIPDNDTNSPSNINRILICQGKVYYDLLEYKEQHGIDNTTICRIEQLYPFPDKDIKKYLEAHKQVKDIIWVQEEPKNMGAWYFVNTRFKYVLQKGQKLRYIGRYAAAAPATGSAKLHAAEQEMLVKDAFEG